MRTSPTPYVQEMYIQPIKDHLKIKTNLKMMTTLKMNWFMPLYKWKSTPIGIPIPHLDFVFHALEYNNHELQFLVCMSPFRGLSSYFKAVFIFEVVFIFELCMPTYAEKMTIFRQRRVHHSGMGESYLGWSFPSKEFPLQPWYF